MHRESFSQSQQEHLKEAYKQTSEAEFTKLMLQYSSSIHLDPEILKKAIRLKWLEWKEPQTYKEETRRIDELTQSAKHMENEKNRISEMLKKKKEEDDEIDILFKQSEKEDRQKKARRAFDDELKRMDMFDDIQKNNILKKCEEIQCLAKSAGSDDREGKLDMFINRCNENERKLLKLFIMSI